VTCKQVADFLDEYLRGTMPEEQRARVEEHLAVCPDCRHYLDQYRQTIALGKAAFAAPDDPVPDSVPEELLAAIRSARPPARR
jgi:anti-sigma factor RsiW